MLCFCLKDCQATDQSIDCVIKEKLTADSGYFSTNAELNATESHKCNSRPRNKPMSNDLQQVYRKHSIGKKIVSSTNGLKKIEYPRAKE